MRISSNLFCLEDNTEQSESNPGRSLGMDKAGMDNYLEDSTLILLSGCLVDSQTKQQNTQSTKRQNTQSTKQQDNQTTKQLVYFGNYLTVINIFSCTFSEKYFLSFVIPPFHLDVIITLIISNLSKVELGWNYRWNFM